MIGPPANLFPTTGIPVCILVLKKHKKFDDVLFIDASKYFEKGKRQSKILPEHIDTYQFRKEEERDARRVQMEEIEANGYNLNIRAIMEVDLSVRRSWHRTRQKL